jgi:rhamnose utilization protein RhaD (predicted bifunctional aldolase and dehydrogenase)/NAD(P)-dependent dehydrogenase (short-subunit alcohol dehydrogenase family)
MKSKFEPKQAENLAFRTPAPGSAPLSASVSPTQALRTYTSRLLGAESALVLHGGGNTSAKETIHDTSGRTIDVLYIKGSGWDLATIEPAGIPPTRLAPLLALRNRETLSDEEMVNELRLALLDASAPTPSVEALLHAFLPAKFIDHTHADAILAIADQDDGENICRSIYGRELVWVPYVMPGFELAKLCAAAFESAKKKGDPATVIVLERHGVFTYGDTAQASYEKMIEVVTRAEDFIAKKRPPVLREPPAHLENAESILLPTLRGALARLANEAPERGPILTLRRTEDVLHFLERKDLEELVQRGCATPDHVIRTKPHALLMDDLDFANPEKLTTQIEAAITTFARAYDAYFTEMVAKKSPRKKLDPWPRVFLIRGVGIVTAGKILRDAEIAADIYEHTIRIIEDAEAVGKYSPVSRDHLFDVEYWSLEQAKIKKVVESALAGKIAIVTGAASGIGRATAEKFLELGAHVVFSDREKIAVENARALIVECDVTNDESVAGLFRSAVAKFGGVDIVVSNAGNAPEGRLDLKAGDEALRSSLDINLLAHNTVARHASEIFLAQKTGGCLLFNASKAAFNPGPSFGPYAVAKTALVALMRQHAIDLGKFGVRSNAVNADRIRTGLFSAEIIAARSKARGLTPDSYFRFNLLEREVTAEDVASAFAYLATARATTGCIITVDGGNAAAFPR